MAMILHAVMNACGETWKAISEYSVRPAGAIEAAAETGHIYLMLTIVLWAAAIVVVLVYVPLNLSRKPRQRLSTTSGEPSKPATSPLRS